MDCKTKKPAKQRANNFAKRARSTLTTLLDFVLACVAIWTLSVSFAPAYADGDQIQICNQNGAKSWYFSVGHGVFNIDNPDYSEGGPLVYNVDPQYRIAPPNPAAPIGCRDNPQQLKLFIILNWPQLEADSYTGPMPKALDEFSMARNPYSHDVTPNIDPLITQWQLEAISCQTKKMIRRWDDGTILCADKTGQLNPLLNSGDFKNGVGWEFIISANVYRTPLGQNLIMDEALNRVEVSYLLIPDLSLGYYWHAPEAASDIDPSYIINIDRLFESALSKFKVQNYRWPQSKNSQNLK